MSATASRPGSGVDATIEPIRAFSALCVGETAYAGGKGANLGGWTAAGLPVPPGFVVGAPAYAAFCDVTGLRGRINAALADLDAEDTAALEAAAAAARDELDASPMPLWLEDAIRAAHARLTGDDP